MYGGDARLRERGGPGIRSQRLERPVDLLRQMQLAQVENKLAGARDRRLAARLAEDEAAARVVATPDV